MGKKNEDGMVIGRKKVYELRFTTDAVVVTDSPERLMLRDLEKYCEKNEMERKSKERWMYKGNELEICCNI